MRGGQVLDHGQPEASAVAGPRPVIVEPANRSQMSSRSASGMPGDGGILFGSSRKIADRRFGDLTGWQHVAPAAESLAELTSHESC
jgi:hypothetical protein